MTDLHTLLDLAAGPVTAVSTSTIDDDLCRADRALRRRHVRSRSSRAALMAAVVGAVALGGPAVFDLSDGTGDGAPASASSAPLVSAQPDLALTAYAGEQPVGFVVAQVPEGWTVRGSDTSSFVIVPPGAAPVPTVVDPAHEGPMPTSWENAVGISLNADLHPDFSGATLQVGDARAVMHQTPPDDGRTLLVEREGGDVLALQVWAGLDLTDDQVLQLAAGVTVTPGATAGVG